MGGDNALKEKVMSRIRIFLVIYTCFLFAAIYVPVGNGLFFLMSVLGLFLSLLVMNRNTMAVSLILFSGPVWGLLFSLWRIPIPGFAAAVCIGFLLARHQWHLLIREKAVIKAMACIFLMFIFSYFMGPMHAYSKEKIVYILVVGLTSTFGWLLLMRSKDIDIEKIAQYLLLIPLLYLWIALDLYGWPHPSSLFDFDFIRVTFYQMRNLNEDMIISYQFVGLSALTSVAFMISSIQYAAWKNIYNMLLFSISLMIIVISQSRQAIFGMGIVAMFRIFLDKKISLSKKVSLLVIVCSLFLVALFSVKSEAINASLSAANSTEFFNRDYAYNMDRIAAIDTFLGLGLGGYSMYGERTYPHNIFIELYGETGIFGIIFIFFVLFVAWIRNPFSLNRISSSKFYMMIPIFVYLIRAMISSDLCENIIVISASVVVICAYRKLQYKYRLNEII